MGIKISKDHLHPSVIESITSLIGDLNQLETEAKGNAVEAINELLANSGNKEELEALIAEIDKLKSILEDEGVSVTEEDDMASLITKVDEEFTEKNNEMENLKQDLIDILTNRGISVEEGLTSEELVNKIDEGTKFELKAGTSGTYLVTFVSSTVGTYSDGVEKTINGTINFDKNKFRITGVSISYSTECEVTTKCNTSLVQYRNDNAIKTHFSVDGKNTNDFGSWSGTVTDVQHGDIFKFVTRHQQVSTTSSAWIRHTLKITCVINI